MKVLLDTNIIIHREAKRIVNQDIGQLFKWIDKLNYEKYIHPITKKEIEKYNDDETVRTFTIKLDNYNTLRTIAAVSNEIQDIIDNEDVTENDKNDSLLLNEVFNERVDIFLTEDKNIFKKARKLGIEDRIFSIDLFLKKVISENPEFIDYHVLSIRKEYFGNINMVDPFFDSLREDYPGFNKWFNNKANEPAYIIKYGDRIKAFLYLKVEAKSENYYGIEPILPPKKRLKIGTFKVELPGLGLGERFLKIAFDNAINMNVDEIYVTIFENNLSQKLLVDLLEQFGFRHWGFKSSESGIEKVFCRQMNGIFDSKNPKVSFPYISKQKKVYFVSIYPDYHTELFPDSLLRTESADDYIENQPHRNVISKVYISHAIDAKIEEGDTLLFYRTGGIYKGVVSTIAIVESIQNNIDSYKKFKRICQGRTVFSESKLKEFWEYRSQKRPFVVNLLYAYSLPKRINLKEMIALGIFNDPMSLPRGFGELSWSNFMKIIKTSNSNESIIVD